MRFSEVQPRWRAWLAITGGGPCHEYIIWITRQWVMFRRMNPAKGDDHAAFDSWLLDECRKAAGYSLHNVKGHAPTTQTPENNE